MTLDALVTRKIAVVCELSAFLSALIERKDSGEPKESLHRPVFGEEFCRSVRASATLIKNEIATSSKIAIAEALKPLVAWYGPALRKIGELLDPFEDLFHAASGSSWRIE